MTAVEKPIDRNALVYEDPVDASLPIIDAHHHLWAAGQGIGGGPAYLHEDLLQDIAGHKVVGTIYCESGTAFFKDGPQELRPVGETEFAVDQARLSTPSAAPILGIVAFADLTLGRSVQAGLDAHEAAGCGLFKGIRQHCGYDPSRAGSKNLLTDSAFREGVASLGRRDFTFDAFVFQHQLPELARFVQSVPGTNFVLNHFGVPVNRGPASRHEVMGLWREGMLELSSQENVFVKIGGIGIDSMFGMGWQGRDLPPTSDEVATWWGEDLRWCIDTFGPSRCMFESNFPVDRWTMGYTVLWNAFQKIAASYTLDEKTALFSRTAQRIYRLDV